tara:strand:+ start:1997 stop:3061 length:1065 start_codon:yes stop_codon:yes gene_type:complete
MEKNFLISTGGSGGHVVPALTLHEHLSKIANIVISTDKRGLRYIDENIYTCEIIDTPKLDNIFFYPFKFFLILFLTFKSFFLLKRRKILKVFSTGGYMSLPLILSSRLLKIKIYLIEPNQVLGRANRFFLKHCSKIFCYTDELINFPLNYRNKMVKIDPLVKKHIYKLKILPEQNKKFTLLVVGGSQGADIFDKNLKNVLIEVFKETPIRIIQQTSNNNVSLLSEFYSKNNVENKIFSFEKSFENIIKQADLCISRGGASTLAEMSLINIPFIVVPLPSAKDNHQYENAKFYKNKDCCWIIAQDNFDVQIEEVLKSIINSKDDLLKKKHNLKILNNKNSWSNVNQKILENLDEN